MDRKWKVPKEIVDLIADITVENWLEENWASFCRTGKIQNTPENRGKAKLVIYPSGDLSGDILRAVEDTFKIWKLDIAFDEEWLSYSSQWETIRNYISSMDYDKAYVGLHYLIPELKRMVKERNRDPKWELWPEGPSLSEVYQGLVYVCGELDYHMENLLAIADRLVLDGHGPREDYSYTALSMFLQHIDQEHGGEIYGHR